MVVRPSLLLSARVWVPTSYHPSARASGCAQARRMPYEMVQKIMRFHYHELSDPNTLLLVSNFLSCLCQWCESTVRLCCMIQVCAVWARVVWIRKMRRWRKEQPPFPVGH